MKQNIGIYAPELEALIMHKFGFLRDKHRHFPNKSWDFFGEKRRHLWKEVMLRPQMGWLFEICEAPHF